MKGRARARSTVEKALTDIDIREDESAIGRLGEAAALLADATEDTEADLPEFEEVLAGDGEGGD